MRSYPPAVFLRTALYAPALLAALGTATHATGQTDLSNDRLNPTAITVTAGSNTVFNSVFSSATPAGDIDFFTLTVPTGLQIDRAELTFYDGPAVSFLGFGLGNTLAASPSEDGATFSASALGFALVGDDNIGGNLFIPLSLGDVNIPGSPPVPPQIDTPRFDTAALGAGTYAFVFQETGAVPVTFELDFTASVVPEPASALLVGLSAAVLGMNRRRRA